MSALRGLVCLDKDGTLVENQPFNVDVARIRPAPGAREALQRLADAGFAVAVVSNQSGVATGRFTAADLVRVRDWLEVFFAEAGAALGGFYVCPHAGGCRCRKPSPTLVERALRDHGVAAASSWMIGDILDDVEAGSRAGCRTVLVANGNETEWLPGVHRQPDVTVADLPAAAEWVTCAR